MIITKLEKGNLTRKQKALSRALKEDVTMMCTKKNTTLHECQFNTQAVVKDLGHSCYPSTETMSSTQLASLLHKEKKEVNRDIKKMFQGKIDGGIITPSLDSRGYVTDFYLPELESKMFVAKKDINYLEKITRFWIDRNNLAQLPNFNDPVIAARAWADQKEARQIAEETVRAQAPKAAALDCLSTADGSMNLTASAKHLQVGPKKLIQYLSCKKWIYKRAGGKNWLGYQRRVRQGLLEHKVSIFLIADGTERVSEQVRVTPKGLAKLSEIFEIQGIC